MISIRRRLTLAMLGVFLLAWLLLIGIVFWNARAEIEDLYDDRLSKIAGVITGLAYHELSDEEEPPEKVLQGVFSERLVRLYDGEAAFQLWYRGRLLVRSSAAPQERFSDAPGFASVMLQGTPWRVLQQAHPSGLITVYVGEPMAGRVALVRHVLGELVGPLALALPVLAVLVWVGIRRGLAPLAQTECEIVHRTPAQLTPISLTRVPQEIHGVVGALNQLLEALQAAMARERRFTSHAAHELRTPLAVLKTQAQLALRADEGAPREHALQQLLQGVDRATRVVSQLLTLTRLDPEATGALRARVDLRAVATDVVAELAPLAVAKHVELGVDGEGEMPVHGIALGLTILVRNLVDNAIRYSPAGARVDVALSADAHAVHLMVSNQGPGIPPEERTRIFEPFYRPAASPPGGAGLGLTIVQRVATFHEARIHVGAGPHGQGTRFTVVFPRPSGHTDQANR
ncbi:ATP-binding protein [Extensimonas soli]|uniref:ATP-binding protein n=1 Tax=Extensimonas soli TaxID=3031322 RepID=UPI0023DB4965|nr:ATP-binding protein [Extensimonas sp. H3M7-6]MDF1481666.1 ATP-binding protein [Extensimonas sp. H3M7-6]